MTLTIEQIVGKDTKYWIDAFENLVEVELVCRYPRLQIGDRVSFKLEMSGRTQLADLELISITDTDDEGVKRLTLKRYIDHLKAWTSVEL